MHKKKMTLVAALLAGGLSGCLGGGGVAVSEQSAPAPQSYSGGGATTVHFALKAGNQQADCGSKLAGIGTGNANAQLTEGLMYVHDVALIDARGQEVPLQLDQKNKWQFLNLALLDFAGGSCKQPGVDDNAPIDGRNGDVVGSVPAGQYVGLSFKVGVPISAKNDKGEDVALNHQPAHEPPHPILGVYWAMWEWQSGHRFMRVDLAPEGGVKRGDGTSDPKWAFHLGSTGCKPDKTMLGRFRCSNPNRYAVKFDSFDPSKERVVLDIAQLFAGNDIARDESNDFGCKSNVTDKECQPIFDRLGLRLAETSLGSNDGGQPTTDGRNSKVFRVEKM